MDKKKLSAYWANTSANSLVGKLVREGSRQVKQNFESLMQGEAVRMEIDEQIVYDQLNRKKNAIWSLLLDSGYLKVEDIEFSREQTFGGGTGAFLPWICLGHDGGTGRQVCTDIQSVEWVWQVRRDVGVQAA